jgi:hypothetical protein
VGLRFVAAAAAILLTLPPAALTQDSRREPAAPEKTRMPAGPLPKGDPEHGRYLAERVAFCIECHSPRDEQGQIIGGQEYTGAPVWFTLPWRTNWADRTPRIRGLPGYTPELAIRLLTQGAVDRQGQQLRPPMPRFRMTDQDAADVYAFLTSLE